MVAKKNNNTNLKNKNLSTDNPFDDQSNIFENNLFEINKKNSVELAQAINEEDLQNLQNDANIEPTAPIEIDQELTGTPLEVLDNLDVTDTQAPTDTQISADELEGDVENVTPQEGLNNNDPTPENIISEEVGPEEITIEGAPQQGLASVEENLDANLTEGVGPTEVIVEGAPSEESGQITQLNEEVQISQEDIESVSLGPEEESIMAPTTEEIADDFEEDISIAEVGPETVIVQGGPVEESLSDIQPVQTVSEESAEEIPPELEQFAGIPLEGDSPLQEEEAEIVDEAPEQFQLAGGPLEGQDQSTNLPLDITNPIETTELSPEQSELDGVPIEGLSEDTFIEPTQLADANPPEQSDISGVPEEGSILEEIDQTIQTAEITPISPQEGDVQDFVNEITDRVLADSIEKGLSPEEAALAALQAGQNAAREAASTPEEITELAQNLSEDLLEDINDKIENIQQEIDQIDIDKKQIKDETPITEEAPIEVAEATTTEAPITDEAPTEIAEATTEAPITEEAPIEVAEATTEAPTTEEAPTEVAEATIEVAETSTDLIPNEVENQADAIGSEPTDIFIPETEPSAVSDLAELQGIPQINTADLNESVQDSTTASIDLVESIDSSEEDVTSITEAEGDEEVDTDEEETADQEEKVEVASAVTDQEEGSVFSNEVFSSEENQFGANSNQQLLSSGLGAVNTAGMATTITPASLVGVTSLGSSLILNPVSSLGTTNLIGDNLSSLLGQQTISSPDLISTFGDISLDVAEEAIEESISEDDNIEEVSSYGDNEEEEGDVIISYDDDGTSDSEEIVYASDVVTPTTNNDELEGGLGETEFQYDFLENVGGIDILTDNGSSEDDKIFFKNFPNSHDLLVTKDSDNQTLNLEVFDSSIASTYSSINTITTAISSDGIGVEDFYLNTDDLSYSDSTSISINEFYQFGGDETNPIAFLQNGGSSSDYFNISYYNSDQFTYSYGPNSQLSGDTYSDLKVTNHLVFGNEGQDYYYVDQNYSTGEDFSATAVVDLGNDNDQLYIYTSPSTGSFFDGGSYSSTSTYDDYDYIYDYTYGDTTSGNHYGINSSNYASAFSPTNFAILSEEGNDSNIGEVGDAYFDNFENLYMSSYNDTLFVDGALNDLKSINGNDGDDKFTFEENTIISDYFYLYGGSGEDDFYFSFDENTTIDTGETYMYPYFFGGVGNDEFDIKSNDTSNVENNLYFYGDDGDDDFQIEISGASNTNYFYGGNGSDDFNFNNAITSNVVVTPDWSSTYSEDKLIFDDNVSNTGLNIENFDSFFDKFEFNSSAFSGEDGHAMVFGTINGTEFMPSSTSSFETDVDGNIVETLEINAFDENNALVEDLLTTEEDYWHYDTNTGILYYDEDADQDMTDSIEIAQITQYDTATFTQTNLSETDFLSSQITYSTDDSGTV